MHLQIVILAACAILVGGILLRSKWWLAGSAAMMVLGVIFGCFISVPTGYVGMLTTFGRVENDVLGAGFHIKAPWQNVVCMNIQEQRSQFAIEAFSADIQQVNIVGSINFSIDQTVAAKLYREVGAQYADTLIVPRVYENTKSVFSRYEAQELIAKRSILSGEIIQTMVQDLERYGVNVLSVSIEDIDFTDAFTDAVEAKQVATQNKLRAETEQEQATMEASAAAERRQIEAEADAQIQKIQADAKSYEIKVQSEAEAEANEKIAKSLNEQLIAYAYANAWNGELPETLLGGENVIPVIQAAAEAAQ